MVVVWNTSNVSKGGEVAILAKAHMDVDVHTMKVTPFDETRYCCFLWCFFVYLIIFGASWGHFGSYVHPCVDPVRVNVHGIEVLARQQIVHTHIQENFPLDQ